MGAKKVYFIDIDDKVIKIAKNNLKFAEKELRIKLDKAEFIVEDVRKFNKKADVILQNPPFGVKVKHADKAFLEKAVEIAPVIYSFHKLESSRFIDKFTKQKGFKMSHFWTFDWPLKMTMKFHAKRIHRVKVGCWRLEKLINN
jgi:putative methylase